MAVLYILIDLDQERRNLAFNTLVTSKWPSLKPVLGRLNPFSGSSLLDGPADEQKKRISSYLEYTEQLLRLKDVHRNHPALTESRGRMLDLLSEYWRKGNFPDQYDYMGSRKLVHLDKRGRVSALGWLVSQTAGQDAAAILDILRTSTDVHQVGLPAWHTWASKSGLSFSEISML
jgi:hypothetical protein